MKFLSIIEVYRFEHWGFLEGLRVQVHGVECANTLSTNLFESIELLVFESTRSIELLIILDVALMEDVVNLLFTPCISRTFSARSFFKVQCSQALLLVLFYYNVIEVVLSIISRSD